MKHIAFNFKYNEEKLQQELKNILKNWVPYQLKYDGVDGWKITWMDLEDRKMVEPFFDETITMCNISRKEKRRQQSFSCPDFMTEVSASIPHLKPSAFIFHVSRCGSTLVTQAFCEMNENIVISEAPLLDEILRATEHVPTLAAGKKEVWFKAALNLMGQKRDSQEEAYIIKLDSWHLHFYEDLRSWFPDTPFFMLSRRPDEVLASHEKRRGIHTVPGMVNKTLLKIDPLKEYGGDFNSYTADVLQQFFLQLQQIRAMNHPKDTFADYGDGVIKMLTDFVEFTAISVAHPALIYDRLNYHSKSKHDVFKKDKIPDIRYNYQHCLDAYFKFRQLTSIY